MKEKILKKLSTISRKNKLLRFPMLAVIFVFLLICHLFQFLNRQKWRMCATFCAVLVFLLSSSFALPELLDMGYEESAPTIYESELEGMMQSGELDPLTPEEEELFAQDFHNYEYDIEGLDAYSTDEILEANEAYLNARANAGNNGDSSATEGDTEFLSDDWRLILINKQHPIPEDYTFELATIYGQMKCDTRVLEDLLLMLQAARDDGVNLIVCSPFRDFSQQVSLFERKVRAYMNRGLSYIDAYKISSQAVTVPGASEHETGLSLDIYTASYMNLDEGFGETLAGIWLAQNSCDYGFILRYPQGKEYITGIEYEPWHFRYVGREAARLITAEQLTLEEFWELYVE